MSTIAFCYPNPHKPGYAFVERVQGCGCDSSQHNSNVEAGQQHKSTTNRISPATRGHYS